MSDTPLYKLTADNQEPIGDLRSQGLKTLVQLREGPNRDLLKQLRLSKFGTFKWKNIRTIADRRATEIGYNNFFWDSYLGYSPIERVLYVDSAENCFFKFENEWKFAVKSSDLGHLAKMNTLELPTIFEYYGEVYCFYADIDAANY